MQLDKVVMKMGKLYLKGGKSTVTSLFGELEFCDDQETLLYYSKLTEFMPALGCHASSIAMRDKYRVFAANGIPLAEVTRNKKKVMPEFEARLIEADDFISTVKKRLSIIKLPIEMTTKTGKCLIEGNVFKKNFHVADADGTALFSIKKADVPWGEASVIEFNDTLADYTVATMVLAIESAYHTGN